MRKLPCLACGSQTSIIEVHHVKTRRNYGDDPWNVMPLCGDSCHRGSKGWHGGRWSFLKAHPHVVEHLKALGWKVDLSAELMFHHKYEVQTETPPEE